MAQYSTRRFYCHSTQCATHPMCNALKAFSEGPFSPLHNQATTQFQLFTKRKREQKRTGYGWNHGGMKKDTGGREISTYRFLCQPPLLLLVRRLVFLSQLSARSLCLSLPPWLAIFLGLLTVSLSVSVCLSVPSCLSVSRHFLDL